MTNAFSALATSDGPAEVKLISVGWPLDGQQWAYTHACSKHLLPHHVLVPMSPFPFHLLQILVKYIVKPSEEEDFVKASPCTLCTVRA